MKTFLVKWENTKLQKEEAHFVDEKAADNFKQRVLKIQGATKIKIRESHL